jgi:DNA-binding transcriptional LysR family regulator
VLDQLEAFVEVARNGAIGRAAAALYITQPALSARIQKLEQDLGAQLFVRGRHGATLTEAGRAFLPFARRALDAVDDGRHRIADVVRGSVGQLSLGASPVVSNYALPAILERFHAEHPGVALSVRTGHSEEILDMVLREQVQVGLVRELQHPGIVATTLYEDELVLVVPARHPFAERGEVEVAELGGEEMIFFDRTSSYHELTSALFRNAGVVPRGQMELDSVDAAKRMVQQGLGVSLLPRTAVAAELRDGTLATVLIGNAPPARRRIVAIHRRDAGPAPQVVAAFLELAPRIMSGVVA